MLAHELSHVAHRDVLVMTVAASAGIARRHADPGSAVRRHLRRPASNNSNTGGLPVWLDRAGRQPRRLRGELPPLQLLSRYRELAADRAGAYLTDEAPALATALQKISGQMSRIPKKDLRAVSAMNAFFIAPAVSGVSLKTLTSDPPPAGAAARAARPDPGRARPADAVTAR